MDTLDKFKIEFDRDGKPVSVYIDEDLFRRLTEGSAFQRTLNVLATMEQVMIESMSDVLNAMTPHHRALALNKIRQKLKTFLTDNPIQNADEDALRLYFDE
jgi:hypothetical protein